MSFLGVVSPSAIANRKAPKSCWVYRRQSLPVELFLDAEEAWFWYVSCQKMRLEGRLRDIGEKDSERPCDPDDIYRELIKLLHLGRLQRMHISILVRYGMREVAPDGRLEGEKADHILWIEAVDRLGERLRAKGMLL